MGERAFVVAISTKNSLHLLGVGAPNRKNKWEGGGESF